MRFRPEYDALRFDDEKAWANIGAAHSQSKYSTVHMVYWPSPKYGLAIMAYVIERLPWR